MPTIGQTLEKARVSLGLTIEDAAHRTRIHPEMLRLIERDDFSHFPSVTYAKSFIRKYSQLLGLDLAEAMDALNSGVARLGDSDLIGEIDRTARKDRLFRLGRFGRRSARRSEKPGGAPLFLNLVLACLMGALAIFYFLGFHAPTPEQAKQEIARGLGLSTPAPAPASFAASEPPAAKPPVALSLEDSLVDRPALPASQRPPTADEPVASIPRPHDTPSLSLTDDAPALPPLPSTRPQPGQAEPQPELNPQGTDPVKALSPARTVEPLAPNASPTGGDQPPPPAPRPRLRAVPVAASD